MDIYDVVIIGAGPAGLTAAIYTSRARLRTLVIDSITTPSQVVLTSEIENYPGFPEGITGFDIIEKFKTQAQNFGAEFKTSAIKNIREHELSRKKAWCIESEDDAYVSFSIIIATGAKPRALGVPGEEKLRGRGVSYCAICDGRLFQDRDIVVVGGGDTAVEEALFLTNFGRKVTMVHRRNRLRATKILQERMLANEKVSFVWNSVLSEIIGDDKVRAIKTKNLESGKEEEIACEGVFIFVGYAPNTDFLREIIRLGKEGYVIVNANMETSKKGIFACGDATKKLLRQVITACGDGAIAGYSARMYTEDLKGVAYK